MRKLLPGAERGSLSDRIVIVGSPAWRCSNERFVMTLVERCSWRWSTGSTGTTAFTSTISDGVGHTATATVTVDVTPGGRDGDGVPGGLGQLPGHPGTDSTREK